VASTALPLASFVSIGDIMYQDLLYHRVQRWSVGIHHHPRFVIRPSVVLPKRRIYAVQKYGGHLCTCVNMELADGTFLYTADQCLTSCCASGRNCVQILQMSESSILAPKIPTWTCLRGKACAIGAPRDFQSLAKHNMQLLISALGKNSTLPDCQ
jgi:hypothetical protein